MKRSPDSAYRLGMYDMAVMLDSWINRYSNIDERVIIRAAARVLDDLYGRSRLESNQFYELVELQIAEIVGINMNP